MITTSTSPLINACDREPELLERLDAGLAPQLDGLVEVRRAGLGADLDGLVGGDVFGLGEAVLTLPHQQALRDGDVTVGEVDDLRALVVDRDAVGRRVELLVGNRLDHAFPRGFFVTGNAVQLLADRVPRVVVPARTFARFRIDVVERQVGVLDGDGDFAALEVGQVARALAAGFGLRVAAGRVVIVVVAPARPESGRERRDGK